MSSVGGSLRRRRGVQRSGQRLPGRWFRGGRHVVSSVGRRLRSRQRRAPEASAACPADAKVANGTVCRASAGVCDVAETCNGVARHVPRRCRSWRAARCAERPAGGMRSWPRTAREARPRAPRTPRSSRERCAERPRGVCDVAETCNGAANACPADDVSPEQHGVSSLRGCVRRCGEHHRGRGCVPGGRQGGRRHRLPRLCRSLRRGRVLQRSVRTAAPPTPSWRAGTVLSSVGGRLRRCGDVHRKCGRVPRGRLRIASSTVCRAVRGGLRCRRKLHRSHRGELPRGRSRCRRAAVCRASAGVCDVAETCSGASQHLPRGWLSCRTAPCAEPRSARATQTEAVHRELRRAARRTSKSLREPSAAPPRAHAISAETCTDADRQPSRGRVLARPARCAEHRW